jgi:hypothetical protein
LLPEGAEVILCGVSECLCGLNALFSTIVVRPIRQRKEMLMLDDPERTTRLLATLKAAAPFEVELTERLVKCLRDQGDVFPTRQIVSDLSYAGDEGGIVCHMLPSKEDGGALVVSLTQVNVQQSLPFAAAIADYQKHRVKKLKKQGHVN